jgi:hypothetical protein
MATETISKVRNSSVGVLNQMKERLWLREHGREFIGQWVLLDGDRFVGQGPDPRPIVAQARAVGVASPFVELISEEKAPFVGGWL